IIEAVSGIHSPLIGFHKNELTAFAGSVINDFPFVNFQINQLSIVPIKTSPFSTRSRQFGTLSNNHSYLVYVARGDISLLNNSESSMDRSLVRKSCHTIALCTGMPVFLSQETEVERCVANLNAAISLNRIPALFNTLLSTYIIMIHITIASYSHT